MEHSQLFYGILGSSAALASAAAWAFGSILFRRLAEKVTPLGMNLFKVALGVLCLGGIMLVTGMKPVSGGCFLLLGISGLLGIALGDTFFFKALVSLGPRLTILVGTLGPVFTVIFAIFFLRERPSLLAWIGILLITGGVTWVLWERTPAGRVKQERAAGIKYALLATLCMSAGIIMAKVGVASTSALQATFIRFLGGIAGLLVYGSSTRSLKTWLTPFKDLRVLRFGVFAVLVAIFGGFWLFLVALKHIDASTAAILNSTTPLFILPMAVFLLKERLSYKAVIGAVVAVCGIVLIFMS